MRRVGHVPGHDAGFLRGLLQAATPLFFSLVFFRRLVVSFSGRVHAGQAPT